MFTMTSPTLSKSIPQLVDGGLDKSRSLSRTNNRLSTISQSDRKKLLHLAIPPIPEKSKEFEFAYSPSTNISP
jgi:hypothetical protein